MILHRNLEFKTIINTFKLTFFSQPCHSLFENIFFLFFLLCQNMHPMNIASTKQMQVMLIACHVIQIVFGIAFRKFFFKN
jgi:hypothetical protein